MRYSSGYLINTGLNCRMLHQTNRPSLQSPLKIFGVLVLHLLLTHSCRGQSQLIGQPIVATVGHDVILPCQLKPTQDVSALTVEWARSDLNPAYVHVQRAGQELMNTKHPSYKGRTSVFIDELKQGNISLKLSEVKLSDEGKYKCQIPRLNKQSYVELLVASDAVSSPVMSFEGIDRERGGVMLQCESKGWYPQPDVFWLDGEGKLLFAEPTKTVRGPDGLYTVSSRVTVEKRHGNIFTCRVQQNNINQTRETNIFVSDDFLNVQSSSCPAITGLAVVLALCIVFIVAVSVFFVWKWKQDMHKTKKICRDETEAGGNNPEMQPLSAAVTDGKTPPQKKNKQWQLQWQFIDKKTLKKELEEKKQKLEKKVRKEEEQRRTEAEKAKKELEKKNKELKEKQDELLKDKLEREKEVGILKYQLDSEQNKIKTLQESEKQLKAEHKKEWEGKQTDTDRLLMKEEQTREKEVKDLKTQLDSKIETLQESEKQLKAEHKKELEGKQAETDRLLQEEKQNREKEVKDLKNQLDLKQKQLEGNQAELLKEKLDREKEVGILKNQLASNQTQLEGKQTDTDRLLQKEEHTREKAEREVEDLKTQLDSKQKQIETLQESVNQLKVQNKELEGKQAGTDRLLQKEEQYRERAEREVKDLKTQLESKQQEIKTLTDSNEKNLTDLKARFKKEWAKKQAELLKEKQDREEEVKDLKNQLESKVKEIETLQKSEKQLKVEHKEKGEGDGSYSSGYSGGSTVSPSDL